MSDGVAGGRDASAGGERLDPFGVAAGLLLNDRLFLIPFCLLLSLPALLDVVFQQFGMSSWTALVILDRIVQIFVVTSITLMWRRRLQVVQTSSLGTLRTMGRIALVSVASSALLAMPVLGMAVNPSGPGSLLFVFLGVIGLVWCLRVYFYFAVVGILGNSIPMGLARAIQISRSDRAAALRALIVPCALTMFLTALLAMPSPDGRSVIWTAVAASAECVFWIVSTYVALGYALTVFTESEWRTAGLTPYRVERLRTIQKQGGERFPTYLRPKFGFGVLAFAFVLMAANLNTQLNAPPAVAMVVKNVVVADYSVQVELEVEDRTFNFRGFHPIAFSLKTKTGFDIASSLRSVSLTPEGTGLLTTLSSADGAPRSLFLTFTTGKTEAALRGLDNMWLWYQFKPVLPIAPEMLQALPRSEPSQLLNTI